jgi:hypothetical protein
MASRFESTFHTRVVPAVERAFGVTVRLFQGSKSTDEFTARRTDRPNVVIGSDFGAAVGIEVRLVDYVLPAASLVIGSKQVKPMKGNRIVEGAETFEIQPPDDSTPAVEIQPGGYEWIVHVKQVI